MGETNYIPLIIESNGSDPIKYYSTSAAAKDCGVTRQTLDYAYRNRCTRIFRQKGGVKSGWLCPAMCWIKIFTHIKMPHSKF